MAWWKAIVSWARRLFGSGHGPRVSGDPQSSNGASSMHLWWELPDGERLTTVRATIEILEPPAVDRLYFWALQVTFAKPDGGAAHLGLQHNRRHPGARAANFGGYSPQSEGGLLDGIESPLPSTPNDPNTRDFDWEPNRRYRLSIERVSDAAPAGFHAWRGAIEDLQTGRFTVVRILFSRGEYLRGPVVWTEAFARCEDPPVAVRWSDLEVVGEGQGVIPVSAASVNYQRRDAGGCDNTNTTIDGGGWVQRTATPRSVASGTHLTVT